MSATYPGFENVGKMHVRGKIIAQLSGQVGWQNYKAEVESCT